MTCTLVGLLLLKMDTLTCYSFWEGSIRTEIFTSVLLVDDFIPHHSFYPPQHPLKDNLVRSSYDVLLVVYTVKNISRANEILHCVSNKETDLIFFCTKTD